MASHNTRTYPRLRAAVLAYLGGLCVRCGFSDPRALQVDHIFGGGTQEVKRIGAEGVYRRVIAGHAGYQLLCANCNSIKRVENREIRGR